MGAPKVLLDTNILISALGWNGNPREIFLKCVKCELELVTSPEQLNELRRVMDYPKLRFTEEQKETFIAILLNIATMTEISGSLKVITEDPDDNAILETAVVGNVCYIISGDPHLLKLKEFGRISIVTAAEFLSQNL